MAGGFYCLWCSARYNSRAALETHAKIHLRSVPRSPARTQCDLCGLSAYRTSLSNPARTPCPRCARRVRVRTDLRRRDHAHTVVVIEVPGLNPTHAEVMAAINNNDICTDKIMDVNKISFAKGTSSVRPCSERALSILSGLQRPVPWNMPEQASAPSQSNAMEDMWRARSVVASHVRLPTILQRGYTLSRLTEGKEAADTKIEQLMRNPNENMTTLQKDPVSMN